MSKTTFNVKNIKTKMQQTFNYDMSSCGKINYDGAYKSLMDGLREMYIAGFLGYDEWKKINDFDKKLRYQMSVTDMMYKKMNGGC